MKRRLIAQRDSLTITLPKDWTNSLNLKAGDEINLKESEENLIINALRTEKAREYVLDVNDLSDTCIRNTLNALYSLSATKIIINSGKPAKLLICKKLTSLFLVGFEITEEGKDTLILESLAIPSENSFDKFFLKLFNFLEFDFNALEECASENKKDYRDEIRRDTKKVTQYVNICNRILLNNFAHDQDKVILFEMISQMKEINHLIFHIFDKKIKISTSEAKAIKDIFFKIRQAHFKNDLKKLNNTQKELSSNPKIFEKNPHIFALSRVLYGFSNSVLRLSHQKFKK